MNEAIKHGRKLMQLEGRGFIVEYDEAIKCIYDLLVELEKAEKVIDAAIDIYDNRLGWSEGRNPYTLISFWEGLNKTLANYKGEIKCQICNDDDLHCNYCTKGEDK